MRRERWVWPLCGRIPLFPDYKGMFGAVRRHHVHTGIDLYCNTGQSVIACEKGVVVDVEKFTGPNALDPSPWWNDTEAVFVRGNSGVIIYGEVAAKVKVGDVVDQGQYIAEVETPVLKRFKGRPTVMLHLELMDIPHHVPSQRWEVHSSGDMENSRPDGLIDPLPYLIECTFATSIAPSFFSLSAYDDRQYRD